MRNRQTSRAETPRLRLREFVEQSWHTIEPGRKFIPGRHIDLISEHLEACRLRQIRRLIINIPPRLTKSIVTSVDFPVWSWTEDPELRFICTSYSASLSTKHSVDRRTVILSPWYQARWSSVFRLSGDQNQKTEFSNDHRGTMIATSVGGSITGKGASIIICDDPHNPLETESDTERERAIEYFDRTLSTRLDDPKTGVIVVIMQRLHQNDLSGHLLSEIGGYHLLKLPMRAEEPERIVFPISGDTFRREPGELLAPERYDETSLSGKGGLEATLGSAGAAAQLQQNPGSKGGIIFNPAWWKFWRKSDEPEVYGMETRTVLLPEKFEWLTHSWDCTFKGSAGSDLVAGGAWGVVGGWRYLLDLVWKRMTFTETLVAVEALFQKWGANEVLVEGKANGDAVVDVLRMKIPCLVTVEPEGGKEARANAVAPTVEAGNVVIPLNASWRAAYIEEHRLFPKAAHDDAVDQQSQALIRLMRKGRRFDLVEYAQMVTRDAEAAAR